MATSDNLMTMMEPCSTFSDSWFSNIMFHNKSLSPETTLVQTSTGSGRTGSACSENEITGSNRGSISTGSKVVGVKGKITKRKKSRASRKNTTTYINADVDSFRHMVQQVTGVRFGGGGDGHVAVAPPPLLKPEPQRAAVVNRLQQVSCCLPTLDTSAFLLDHVASQQMVDPTSTSPPDVVVGGGSCGGFDFSSFSGFPTLESWKAI